MRKLRHLGLLELWRLWSEYVLLAAVTNSLLYYAILIFMTLLGAVAAVYLKLAVNAGEVKQLIHNKNLYIGGSLYLLSAVLNIYILKFLAYSLVLPLTAITYIWILILGGVFLQEKITRKKMVGVALICIGTVLIVK